MDGERLDAATEFYAGTLAKHPDAWRAIRRTSAIVAAGDVAMESVRNCNFARDWPRERLVAVHEAGHALMRFFLMGEAGATAPIPGGGGIAGSFSSQAEAEEAFARGEPDGEILAPIVKAVPDRLRRLTRAVEVFMRRTWVWAALLELAKEKGGRFATGDENTQFLAAMFPRTPAYRRAVLLASHPAPAPGVEAGAGGGAGEDAGVLRGVGAGEARPGAGSEGARTAEAGRNEQIGSDLAGAVDQDPVGPENLTINQKGNRNV